MTTVEETPDFCLTKTFWIWLLPTQKHFWIKKTSKRSLISDFEWLRYFLTVQVRSYFSYENGHLSYQRDSLTWTIENFWSMRNGLFHRRTLSNYLKKSKIPYFVVFCKKLRNVNWLPDWLAYERICDWIWKYFCHSENFGLLKSHFLSKVIFNTFILSFNLIRTFLYENELWESQNFTLNLRKFLPIDFEKKITRSSVSKRPTRISVNHRLTLSFFSISHYFWEKIEHIRNFKLCIRVDCLDCYFCFDYWS